MNNKYKTTSEAQEMAVHILEKDQIHPHHIAAIVRLIRESEERTESIKKIALKGREVVEDFMPNIGRCALQDYGRLNQFLLDTTALKS